MYIQQAQLRTLSTLVRPGKVVVIYGARQVGKTTLLKHFVDGYKSKSLVVSGEDLHVRDYLESQSIEKLKSFIGSANLLVVDEAQAVRGVGLNLKLIVDHLPAVAVIATGSSSFELASKTGEPLTGRKFTLPLYPLAQMEIGATENPAQTRAHLEMRLIYGSYPEAVIMEDNSQRERYLQEMVASYLLKDILRFEGVRFSDKILRLLQLLAFQIGGEVSCSELGSQLGISKNTVDRYLDILEKAFVIYRRTGFSRNQRKEITKNSRFYFNDNGIRNALIRNFNPISLRDDIGMLWENYILAERLKFRDYSGLPANSWFWRTYDRHEVDLVEEAGGKLSAYEIKWSPSKSASGAWLDSYPGSSLQVINRENYLSFVS